MKYKIDEIEYPVEVIRKNNKNTYIRIKDGTIEVSTHYFVTKKQILDLLGKNESSIRRMITKCQQKQEKQEKFTYLGQCYDIIMMPTDEVEIVGHHIYTSSEEQLNKWYQKQMKKIFETYYQMCYQKFKENIPFYRLRIRKMKTRWGVCNRKSKTITLNSELLHYETDAIIYVIIHELSHLIHFNHSREFWNTVGTYCPNYKEMRKILKE